MMTWGPFSTALQAHGCLLGIQSGPTELHPLLLHHCCGDHSETLGWEVTEPFLLVPYSLSASLIV